MMLCGTVIPPAVADILADLVAKMTVNAIVVASNQMVLNASRAPRSRKTLGDANRVMDNADSDNSDNRIKTAWIAVETLPVVKISEGYVSKFYNDGFIKRTIVLDFHHSPSWSNLLSIRRFIV